MASCRSWVKRAVLGVSRSLPVFPGEPTLWLSFRMSQWCQQETLLRGKQAASEFLSIPFLQLLTTENPPQCPSCTVGWGSYTREASCDFGGSPEPCFMGPVRGGEKSGRGRFAREKRGGCPPERPGPRGARNIPAGRKSRIRARSGLGSMPTRRAGGSCSGSSCRRMWQARRSHSRRVRRGPRAHGRALRRKMPGCSHAPMVSDHRYRFPCGRLRRTDGRLSRRGRAPQSR